MTHVLDVPHDGKRFLTSLESVRGLAALSVALFHSFHLVPVNGARVFDHRLWQLDGFTQWVLRLIMVPFNGGAAVSLFFVLSGFVLHLSLQRERALTGPAAARFSARRLLRIYPALAVNLLVFVLAWAICERLFPGAGFVHFTAWQIVENFSLHDVPVNGVTWTLLIEIMAVPCMLLTTLTAARWGIRGVMALTLFFFVVAVTPLNFKFEFVKSYYIFSGGALVAQLYATPVNIGRRSAQAMFAVSLASLMLARLLFGHFSKWSVLVEAISGAALIASLVLGPQGRAHQLLAAGASRFLGRVSYSFYLYHPMVLTAAYLLLARWAPEWMSRDPILASIFLALVSVPPALVLGALSYRAIERPMVRVGRMI